LQGSIGRYEVQRHPWPWRDQDLLRPGQGIVSGFSDTCVNDRLGLYQALQLTVQSCWASV